MISTLQMGHDPVPLSRKHHVNKRKASLCLRLKHNAEMQQTYFSNTRENARNNYKDLLNNNIILNKLIKSSSKQI